MGFTAGASRLKLAASPHTPNCLMWVPVTVLFNFGPPASQLAYFFSSTTAKTWQVHFKNSEYQGCKCLFCTDHLTLCHTEQSHEVRNLPRCFSYDHLCQRATISHTSPTARTSYRATFSSVVALSGFNWITVFKSRDWHRPSTLGLASAVTCRH